MIEGSDASNESVITNIFTEIFTGGYVVQGKRYEAGVGDLENSNFGAGIKIKIEDLNIEQLKKILEVSIPNAINRKRFTEAGGNAVDMDYNYSGSLIYERQQLTDVWGGDGDLYDQSGNIIGTFDNEKGTYTMGSAINSYENFGDTETKALSEVLYGQFPSDAIPTGQINQVKLPDNIGLTDGVYNTDISSVDNFYNNWIITRTSSLGATLNSNINDSQTNITVNSTTGFRSGDLIIIEDEYIFIESISGNTLTVFRGAYNYNSNSETTAVSHTSGTSVSLADSWTESFTIISYDGTTQIATLDYTWHNTNIVPTTTFTLEKNDIDYSKTVVDSYEETLGANAGFGYIDPYSDYIDGDLGNQAAADTSLYQIKIPSIQGIKNKNLTSWTITVENNDGTQVKVSGTVTNWNSTTKIVTVANTSWLSDGTTILNPTSGDYFNITKSSTNYAGSFADPTETVRDTNTFFTAGASSHRTTLSTNFSLDATQQNKYFNDNFIVEGSDLDASKVFAYNWDDYFIEYAMWYSNRFSYWTNEYVKIGFGTTPSSLPYCKLTVKGSFNSNKAIIINKTSSDTKKIMTALTNRINEGTVLTNRLIVASNTVGTNLNALEN